MMLADNVVTALLHANRVLTVLELRMDWMHWVLLPLAGAAAVFGGGAWLRIRLLAAGWDGLWTALAVGAAMAAVYLALLVLLRCFTPQELRAVLAPGKKRTKT